MKKLLLIVLAFPLAGFSSVLDLTVNSDGTLAKPTNFFSANVTPLSAALASIFQPLDSDLTAIAALSTTSFGRSLLTQADAAATRATLGLGTAATSNATAFAGAPASNNSFANLDWSTGTFFYDTLSGNTNVTFSNVVVGKEITVAVTGAISWGINWPGSVTWTNGTPANPGPGVTKVFRFVAKSSSVIFGTEDTALSTWVGSGNITTLGTVQNGVWHGTAIADTYIASAATWNAKQAAGNYATAASGKTGVFNNTLTLSGTDGSTLNVGSGGTLGTAAYTAASAYDASGAATTAQAYAIQRANHTGTQAESTVVNLVSDLAGKEPTITAGTNLQYWRGDKTWQTLNSTAVGLSNVENTALSTWTGSGNLTTLASGAARANLTGGTGTLNLSGFTLTLPTVNSTVGSFGSATQVATFTVNAQGLVTVSGNTTISIPAANVSDSTSTGRAVLTGSAASATVALVPASVAISSTAIDWSAGSVFTKTLSANTTFTFSNTKDGQTIIVRLTNTASNYTVTWPTVKWSGGTAPTMTTGAHRDVYTFFKDGSDIYGSAVQNF